MNLNRKKVYAPSGETAMLENFRIMLISSNAYNLCQLCSTKFSLCSPEIHICCEMVVYMPNSIITHATTQSHLLYCRITIVLHPDAHWLRPLSDCLDHGKIVLDANEYAIPWLALFCSYLLPCVKCLRAFCTEPRAIIVPA